MRDATRADAACLAALWAKARPEARLSEADIKEWLASARALMLEDAGGRALAAVRYREEEGGWRVEPIVTDPEQRGQGFGRWLMTTLEASAIRENVAFLALDVEAPRSE